MGNVIKIDINNNNISVEKAEKSEKAEEVEKVQSPLQRISQDIAKLEAIIKDEKKKIG